MVTLFIGENTAQRDKAFKAYVAKFVSNNGQMAVDSLNTEDVKLNNVVDAVTTVPFLSSKRLVVIRYLGVQKDIASQIDTILKRTADTTDLVFVETSLDKRGIYYKTLIKKADEVKKFDGLDGASLTNWLTDDVADSGGEITRQSAQYLIDRVGTNQQLLSNDAEKMLLVSSRIDNKLIDAMTHSSPHSSVFNMLDSIARGQANRVSKLYDEQRAQGMEPQAILGMLVWQLFIMANIVVAPKDTPDIIAKRSKLSPFVVKKTMNMASNISKRQMVDLLDITIKADADIKTGKSKADVTVHNLLLELATRVQ